VKLVVKNYRCFSDQYPARLDLSKESIALVGENNTGKSALIRLPHELRPTFATLSAPSNIVWSLNNMRHPPLATLGLEDPSNIYCLANSRSLAITIQVQLPVGLGASAPNSLTFSADRADNTLRITISRDGVQLDAAAVAYPYTAANGLVEAQSPTQELLAPLTDALRDLSRAKYIGAHRNLITQTQGLYYDIQMGTELVATWNQWKFGGNRRLELKCRTLEERIRRAFALSRFEIRTNASRTMMQVLIDDRTYLLNEVGTGLAQYILVGANLLINPCTYALIDEPESNLHPGIQGDFLEMIEEYAEKSVVYATHSLGLANTYSSEAHITERLPDGTTRLNRLDPRSPRSTFMRALVYSGFLDVGADTVVMVEGTHDVNATKAFLRILGKRHNGAVLSIHGDETIGGNADAYLDELLKIIPADHLIFVIDSERSSETDVGPVTRAREAFKALCDARRIRCLVTERRAFENYLATRAVQVVKGDNHRGLTPYEKLDKNARDLWAKPENASIAAEMTAKEILETDLGRFLNDNVALIC
jgi:ABC-type dipeptide/oligopeptide/nickel transport system ATPase component